MKVFGPHIKRPCGSTVALCPKERCDCFCHETTGMIGDSYICCGLPAVAIVQHRDRTEGPYPMCFGCANHNTHNRNAEVIEQLAPTA